MISVGVKAVVVGLMLTTEGTGKYFAPKTTADIGKLLLQGVVCKTSGEVIGGFASAQIIVKGGVVYFRDPATNQVYEIPKELVVVITPLKRETLMRSRK